MTKYGFDYFVKRAETLEEMAGRPPSHKLIAQVIGGLSLGDAFKKITSDISNRVYKGVDEQNNPLTDSAGRPAAAMKGAAGDDRYNKWLLSNLIRTSDTEDVNFIEPSEENIDRIYNSPLGRKFKEKFPGGEHGAIEQWIYKLLNKDSSPLGQARRIVVANSMKDNEDYLQHGDKGSQMLKSAMMLIIKNNPGILKDPEFLSDLYSTEGLATYINSPDTGLVMSGSGKSVNTAIKKLQELGFDVDKDDTDDVIMHMYNNANLLSQVLPILKDINKEHGYKHGRPISVFKRRKQPADGVEQSPEPAGESTDPEDETPIFISAVLKYIKQQSIAIKDAIARNPMEDMDDKIEGVAADLNYKPEDIKTIGQMNIGTINVMIDFVKKRYESGSGLTFERFFQFLDTIKDKFPAESKTVDFLNNQIYVSSKIKPNLVKNDEEGKTYKGFDEKILQQKLDTPEKEELFARYYEELYLPTELARLNKDIDVALGSISSNQRDENKAFEDFKNRTVSRRTNLPVDRSKMDWKPNFEEIKAKLEDKPEEEWTPYDVEMAKKVGLVKSNDDGFDDEKAFNVLRQDAEEKLKPKMKLESYVMNYMTEQVSRDKFQTKGEFKDRGFKKMNYDQWLRNNQ